MFDINNDSKLRAAYIFAITMVRNAAKNPKASPWITATEAEEILGGGKPDVVA